MRRVFPSPRTQPQLSYPVAIDRSHRLAAGLVGCYVTSYIGLRPAATSAPIIRDLAGIADLQCVDGTSTMGLSPLGFAANGDGGYILGNGWQTPSAAAQRPAFGVSLFLRCYKAAGGISITSYPMLFGCQWSNDNSAPYDTWTIVNGPSDDRINFNINVAGSVTSVNLSGQIATGVTYNLGMTAQADGVAGNLRPFINGVLQTTGTASSGSIGYGTTPTICLNGKVGTSANSGMQVVCGYIWNRRLSDTEMAWLNAEPYAMLRPTRRRVALPTGAAVGGGGQTARVMVLA